MPRLLEEVPSCRPSLPLSSLQRSTPPTGTQILFEESFEDTDLSSRGWYDLQGPRVVFDAARGGNVLEMTFESGISLSLIGVGSTPLRGQPYEVYFTDDPGPRYKVDWHRVEVFLGMNSAVGVPNGLARYWHDGQLVIDLTDVVYNRVEDEDAGFLFNQLLVAPWMAGPDGNGSPVTQTMWIDDLVAGTGE